MISLLLYSIILNIVNHMTPKVRFELVKLVSVFLDAPLTHFGGRLSADYDRGSRTSVRLHDVAFKVTAIFMACSLLCLLGEWLKC
jgi:hypothetical protein